MQLDSIIFSVLTIIYVLMVLHLIRALKYSRKEYQHALHAEQEAFVARLNEITEINRTLDKQVGNLAQGLVRQQEQMRQLTDIVIALQTKQNSN